MTAHTRIDNARVIRAPRGNILSAKSWLTEAPLRMLMNNLDPDVAERPGELVVYGGIGRAARDWHSFDQIVASLRKLEEDQTLLVQSGKPVGIFRTHKDAPRVLIANSNLVPHWATWDHFHELDKKGLMMYGQMTAGSWIYIGTQGILQGTYETFVQAARTHFNTEDLAGRVVLTGGLGGMGGAQPLACTMAGGVMLAVEVDAARAQRRIETKYIDVIAKDLDEALALVQAAKDSRQARSIGVIGNCAEVLPAPSPCTTVGFRAVRALPGVRSWRRRYRPALMASGKARVMTRQIALGAIIAFGVTVLALSVWEPKPLLAPAPPPPAPALQKASPFKPASLRPEAIGRIVRQPLIVPAQLADAGAPSL